MIELEAIEKTIGIEYFADLLLENNNIEILYLSAQTIERLDTDLTCQPVANSIFSIN